MTSSADRTNFGVDPGDGVHVLAFAATEPPDPGRSARLRRVVSLSLRTHLGSPAIATLGSVLYAVCGSGRGMDRLVGDAHAVAIRAEAGLDVGLRVGIGEAGLPAISRLQADAAVAVLERRAAVGVARFRDVRAAALLDATAPLTRVGWLGTGPVHDIVAHDATHGTPYAVTLRAYLDAHGNVAAAAQLLVVHVSTLRYRLARIADRFSIDLTDPDVRLAIDLELRALAPGSRPDVGRPV